MKLNKDQRKQLAEIFGNIAVAWFSAGVIGSFFLTDRSFEEIIKNLTVGLLLASFFIFLSLELLSKRRRKNE